MKYSKKQNIKELGILELQRNSKAAARRGAPENKKGK